MYTFLYIYIWTYIYVHICTYTYIHIYIHTYMHIWILLLTYKIIYMHIHITSIHQCNADPSGVTNSSMCSCEALVRQPHD